MQNIPKILLAIETSRSYGRGLLRGIFRYSHIHGPWILIHSQCFYNDGSGFSRQDGMGTKIGSTFSDITLSYIEKKYFDGIIIRDQKNLRLIRKLEIPVILASYINKEPGIACIQTDCSLIGKMAAGHFLERGFRNFGYCGLSDMYWSDLRCKSFQASAEQAGYTVATYQQPRLKKDRIRAREQHFLVKWLKSLPRPIGILASDDERGRDLIESCTLAGLRVPEDVAVLGVDNDDLVCEMSHVPISSIELNVQQAGYEAAELLSKMMKKRKDTVGKIIVRPNRVVVRQSTEILAIDDNYIADAIRYIRMHVREPIQVTDVANSIALSRRALYEKFQQVLGCSVHQYIKRLRVEEIGRLLLESEKSISEIAYMMGFGSVDHIAQYFRKYKGVSPSAYRKQLVS